MNKDQCYVQTLRTFYLHRILLPLDLFIAKRSVLRKASQWLLKQMIISSSSQDISNLVLSNLVIANWSTDNSVNTDCLETFLVLFERFSSQWPFRLLKSVKYSRVMVWIRFVIMRSTITTSFSIFRKIH